jgi:hypothetical protein
MTYLNVWPTGQPQPLASTINSYNGQVLANAAIVAAGTNGEISIGGYGSTDVILDIDGYFAPPATGGLSLYTVPPCRIADTRNANGPLGGPAITGGARRDFPILSSSCGIPSTAVAYSLNVTIVPQSMTYLNVWPTGQPQPLASTINSYNGQVLANAAIVAAGTNGEISIGGYGSTDVILDIGGYFAP